MNELNEFYRFDVLRCHLCKAALQVTYNSRSPTCLWGAPDPWHSSIGLGWYQPISHGSQPSETAKGTTDTVQSATCPVKHNCVFSEVRWAWRHFLSWPWIRCKACTWCKAVMHTKEWVHMQGRAPLRARQPTGNIQRLFCYLKPLLNCICSGHLYKS